MEKRTFGQRAYARRKELGLSQRELAKRVGVAHVTISQWERDETEPTGSRLFMLAKGLQCDAIWLLSGGDAPSTEALEIDSGLPTQKERHLLDLFNSLPESDQEGFLGELEARVVNNRHRLQELLAAEKKSRKK